MNRQAQALLEDCEDELIELTDALIEEYIAAKKLGLPEEQIATRLSRRRLDLSNKKAEPSVH